MKLWKMKCFCKSHGSRALKNLTLEAERERERERELAMEESSEGDQECSSSTSARLHPTFAASPASSPFPPDEISLLLHQILRSSSSFSPIVSSSFSSPQPSFFPGITPNPMTLLDYSPPSLPSAAERRLSAVISSDVINQSSSGVVLDRTDVPYREDWDCESQGGLGGLVERVSAKPEPRTTSKRSRAAQVHNLSEKRRRSRINEKLKALQNLIPNSSKTDKASVLDEAIEYLKQLLLQLQMLSIRSGFALQPISLPVSPPPIKLSHNRINFGEEDSSAHSNMANMLSLHHQRALHLQKSSKEMNSFEKLELEKMDVDRLEAKQRAKFLPFISISSSSESPFSLFPPS